MTGTLYWPPPASGGVPLGAVLGLVAVALGGVALVPIVRRRRRAGDDGDGPEPGDGPAPTVTAPEAKEAW